MHARAASALELAELLRVFRVLETPYSNTAPERHSRFCSVEFLHRAAVRRDHQSVRDLYLRCGRRLVAVRIRAFEPFNISRCGRVGHVDDIPAVMSERRSVDIIFLFRRLVHRHLESRSAVEIIEPDIFDIFHQHFFSLTHFILLIILSFPILISIFLHIDYIKTEDG